MLDKTVPFYGVLMIKSDTKNYPCFNLPDGYEFSGYHAGFETAWAEMMFALEQTDTLAQAEEIFKYEFLSDAELLKKQCLFILDNDKNIAATASLWHGAHFGQTLPRLHWVATKPEYQGKGLMKAMISRLFDIHNELGYRDFIYLTTQTWSYKAINIYEKFGFKPYLGAKPTNWISDDFNHNNLAWNIISNKIIEYRQRVI